MLQAHRKDEWDKYLNSLNHNEYSIYKFNRYLLRKRSFTHSILGPTGLSYSAEEKTKIIADSLERQFSTFQYINLLELTESITTIRGSVFSNITANFVIDKNNPLALAPLYQPWVEENETA